MNYNDLMLRLHDLVEEVKTMYPTADDYTLFTKIEDALRAVMDERNP